MTIFAQLDAPLEFSYGTGGAFVLVESLAIAIGAYPIDGGAKTGLLLVHVTIEDQVIALLLVAREVIIVFGYPDAIWEIRYELSILGSDCACNGI